VPCCLQELGGKEEGVMILAMGGRIVSFLSTLEEGENRSGGRHHHQATSEAIWRKKGKKIQLVWRGLLKGIGGGKKRRKGLRRNLTRSGQ